MADETKVNMHGTHVASCLCCAHLDMGYEGDWSDVTPGRGYYCDCNKGHFYSLDTDENHKLIVLGQNCVDFVARDAG